MVLLRAASATRIFSISLINGNERGNRTRSPIEPFEDKDVQNLQLKGKRKQIHDHRYRCYHSLSIAREAIVLGLIV
jgi:hypothetical protein